MKGTILEQILKRHLLSDKINELIPGDVIPIKVDHLFIPDNSVMPIFKIMEQEKIQAKNTNIYLGLTHFRYQYEENYSSIQRDICDLAKKYKFKILENYKGLWQYQILNRGILQPGEIFLGRDSTVNFFAPLNSLNISSGIQDIIQCIITCQHDYIVPAVIHVQLEGTVPKNISGKDISLFLKHELFEITKNKHCLIEFSGSVLEQLSPRDLYTISQHHFAINASAFIFPPLKQIYRKTQGLTPLESPEYSKELRFDISKLNSLIEFNNSIHEVHEFNLKQIDKVFIGNSIGGSLQDMKFLAQQLENKKVKIPCFVIPGSSKILLEATEKGYLEIILKSGCILLAPATGICSAMNNLIPIKNERIMTTAINSISIQVKHDVIDFYTASIETAVATALIGKISDIGDLQYHGT